MIMITVNSNANVDTDAENSDGINDTDKQALKKSLLHYYMYSMLHQALKRHKIITVI